MSLGFSVGHYYPVFMPLFAGAAVGTVVAWAVAWTHCRNRWLAGAVGGVLGVVTFLGYYQFSLARALPRAAWRADVLPKYIMFRLRTDVILSAHDVNAGQQEPVVVLNYVFFVADLLLLAGTGAVIPWKRASQGYCRELSQWMERESTIWPADRGDALQAALETGKLVEFVATTPPGSGRFGCRLTLEYTAPAKGSPFDYPIYATLRDQPKSAPWYRPRLISRTLLRQVAMKPGEVLSLKPLFPKLARLLAERHPELRAIPDEVIAATSAPASATAAAEITRVAGPTNRHVCSGGFYVWTVILRRWPLLLFCVSLFLAFVAAFLFFMGLGLLPAAILGPPSLAALVWGAYTGLFCSDVAASRSMARRLRTAIAGRTGPLVSANDPDALLALLIPRQRLAAMSMRPADVMLLSIDAGKQRLVMEGDYNRYCIPAGSIEKCEVQKFFGSTDHREASPIWLVRLMVRVEFGLRELLLSVKPTRYTPMLNRSRRRQVEALCRQILALGDPPASSMKFSDERSDR
jgi:hypothetical protein